MAKKKKLITQVVEVTEFQYRVKVMACKKSRGWTKGEFVKDEKTKKVSYTGHPIDELVGYQVGVVVIIDGKEITTLHKYPTQWHVFDTEEEAREYLVSNEKLQIGQKLNPNIMHFSEGVIIE